MTPRRDWQLLHKYLNKEFMEADVFEIIVLTSSQLFHIWQLQDNTVWTLAENGFQNFILL